MALVFLSVWAKANLGYVERRPSESVYIQNDSTQLTFAASTSRIVLVLLEHVEEKARGIHNLEVRDKKYLPAWANSWILYTIPLSTNFYNFLYTFPVIFLMFPFWLLEQLELRIFHFPTNFQLPVNPSKRSAIVTPRDVGSVWRCYNLKANPHVGYSKVGAPIWIWITFVSSFTLEG